MAERIWTGSLLRLTFQRWKAEMKGKREESLDA
jgi:hypothetical protein